MVCGYRLRLESYVVLVATQIETASEMNMSVCPGENEDEKLNEVMYEAWRFNRDCKLLREGLQGLSWDGQYQFISSLSVFFIVSHETTKTKAAVFHIHSHPLDIFLFPQMH